AGTAGCRYLPLSGSGDFDLHATFAAGRLRSATGKVASQALTWPASSPAGVPLALAQLRGTWQLARRAEQWHLSIDALELGPPAATPATASSTPPGLPAAALPPASLVLDAALDG